MYITNNDAAIKLDLKSVYRFTIIALNTGMRPNETFKLEFDSIDLNAKRITVYQSKVDESKCIPINEKLMILFESLFAGKTGKYILNNSDEPFIDSSFNKQWVRVRKEACVDVELVPYSCRYTFATRLVEAEVLLRRIMKYTGHKTLEMDMRYTHPEERDDDLALLDNLSVNNSKIAIAK